MVFLLYDKGTNGVLIILSIRSHTIPSLLPLSLFSLCHMKITWKTTSEDLLAAVLIAIKDRTKIDPSIVDDICVGTVLQASGGATVSRQAALYAGYPEKTSIYTTNRQCSSGLQAVVNIAAHIQAGLIDIGIGAGVESMTMGYGPSAMAPRTSEIIPAASQAAADCNLPMGYVSFFCCCCLLLLLG